MPLRGAGVGALVRGAEGDDGLVRHVRRRELRRALELRQRVGECGPHPEGQN